MIWTNQSYLLVTNHLFHFGQEVLYTGIDTTDGCFYHDEKDLYLKKLTQPLYFQMTMGEYQILKWNDVSSSLNRLSTRPNSSYNFKAT